MDQLFDPGLEIAVQLVDFALAAAAFGRHPPHFSTAAYTLYLAKRPHLVFLDVNIPGVDGIEVLRVIKEEDPNANVIMCTANLQRATIVRFLQAGARAYVAKPIDEAKVRKAIRAAYGQEA